ncbi:hypothetical protein TDB9533_03820 [Thalassocella blandensis]|nr:hypothetical protein TDB9533_03820 [Thalassocella blandensis]
MNNTAPDLASTYTIKVPPGSGSRHRTEHTECILYPRPPLGPKKRVWYFSVVDKSQECEDPQYENMIILFKPELKGPQDSYIVTFTMDPAAKDWTFVAPGIEYKEVDQNHDIEASISDDAKTLRLHISFNAKLKEILNYFFTAQYKGTQTTSVDPILVLGARPPR